MRRLVLVSVVAMMAAMANAEIVNFWDFETISAGTVPAEVGPNNLVIQGATTALSTDAKWGNTSLNSPTGEFLYSSTGLQNTLTKGTFATWVKSTNNTLSWRGVLSTNIRGNVSNNMRIDLGASTSQLYVWDIPSVSGTGTNTIVPTVNLADGQWHFLVLTYDATAGVCNFYADGVLNGTAGYGTTNAKIISNFQISTKQMLSGQATGLLVDDTAVFSTALTSQEVAYYNTHPIPEPATMSLLLLAGGLVGLARRKR